MASAKKILITGGVKSGKSSHALKLANEFGARKAFLATAEMFDDEMKEKIKRHRIERGSRFTTFEEPLELSSVIEQYIEDAYDVVVIDCMCIWVNNLMYHYKEDDMSIMQAIEAFLTTLAKSRLSIIIATNEAGQGIIPDNQLSRDFMVRLGITNQKLAGVCDEVIHMISGLPQKLKTHEHEKVQ